MQKVFDTRARRNERSFSIYKVVNFGCYIKWLLDILYAMVSNRDLFSSNSIRYTVYEY